MMVKVFTKNENGKIEFTEEELKKLLNEVFYEGYNSNNYSYYIILLNDFQALPTVFLRGKTKGSPKAPLRLFG